MKEPKLAPRNGRNKLGTIKSNRALSLDHHNCGDLRELPLEAFTELSEIFGQMGETGFWPMNDTLIPIALIPKQDRGIGPSA